MEAGIPTYPGAHCQVLGYLIVIRRRLTRRNGQSLSCGGVLTGDALPLTNDRPLLCRKPNCSKPARFRMARPSDCAEHRNDRIHRTDSCSDRLRTQWSWQHCHACDSRWQNRAGHPQCTEGKAIPPTTSHTQQAQAQTLPGSLSVAVLTATDSGPRAPDSSDKGPEHEQAVTAKSVPQHPAEVSALPTPAEPQAIAQAAQPPPTFHRHLLSLLRPLSKQTGCLGSPTQALRQSG